MIIYAAASPLNGQANRSRSAILFTSPMKALISGFSSPPFSITASHFARLLRAFARMPTLTFHEANSTPERLLPPAQRLRTIFPFRLLILGNGRRNTSYEFHKALTRLTLAYDNTNNIHDFSIMTKNNDII